MTFAGIGLLLNYLFGVGGVLALLGLLVVIELILRVKTGEWTP